MKFDPRQSKATGGEMRRGLLGLVACWAASAAAGIATAGEVNLLTGLDGSRVSVVGGTLTTVDGRLVVTSTGGKCEVRILAPSASGTWDLSESAELRVDVSNTDRTGTRRVVVGALNGQSDGISDAVWGMGRFTAPGVTTSGSEAGQVIVRLIRRPLTPEPFGAGKYPGMKEEVKLRVGTLDPTTVASLVMRVEGAVAGERWMINSVRATGAGEKVGGKGPVPFFPFVDTYGQYRHRDWEGKIHSDAELAASTADELAELNKLPDMPGWDRFGGWGAGPRLKATGSFRAEKYGGRWWLVTPDGTLFFSTGPTGVRSTEAGILTGRETWYEELPDRGRFGIAFAAPAAGVGAYDPDTTTAVSFLRVNLMRKYGPEWRERAARVAELRLRKHGMNSMGNWSERAYYIGGKTPYTVPVEYRPRMLRTGWNKFPDIFDAKFVAQLDAGMKAAADKTAEDPYNIGYFVDNELGWGTRGYSLAETALVAPADQPAKLELIKDLRAKYGEVAKLNAAWGAKYESWDAMVAGREKATDGAVADLITFQKKIAREYYKMSRDVVRKYAPQKLYLGCRMANYCGLYDDLLDVAAEYCDVVSFNIYRWAPEADEFAAKHDRPILIGEFGYWGRGVTPFNTVGAPGSFPDRAKSYTDYVEGVLRRPNFVGCHMYLYADQVISGRGDGEAQPTGFVTVTDQPKPDLFNAARVIGQKLYSTLGPPPARP